mmetsp:Transcript_7267/g.20135  ORF Transcript_7267/g.20135 Transcript_7267/m.20135 type:complete len:225 (+) Transcript_7267:783-1457(+)
MVSASVFLSIRLSVWRSTSSASGTSASRTSSAARAASLSRPLARARCSTASCPKMSLDSSAASRTAGKATCSNVLWAWSLSSCHSMSSAARRTCESSATSPVRRPRSTCAMLLCNADSAMASMPAPMAVWCTTASSVMSTPPSSDSPCRAEAAMKRSVKLSLRPGGGSREMSLRCKGTALLLPGSNTATRSLSFPSPWQERPATSPRAPNMSLSPLGNLQSVPP